MPEQLVQQESMRFTPSTLVSLFTLNGQNIGLEEPFYFCDGVASSWQPIVFNGQAYAPFPILATKFGYDGTGKPVRPTLTASNINGFVSQLLLNNQNLIGAMFIRQRVFARFLDAANFPNNVNPWGTPDPTAAYPEEIWYVNRKVQENQQLVEWELASLFETDGLKLPRRQIISNVCGVKYRDPLTCGYSGVPLADKNNIPFIGSYYGFSSLNNRGLWSPSTGYNAGDYVYIVSNLPQFSGLRIFYVCLVNGTAGNANSPINNPSAWVQDYCPKSIAGCKIRFPAPATIRGGFFPGTAQAPWISQQSQLI
jgi:lambda family phage minor tail protein L